MPKKIYVQEVIIYWTKASRGAPASSVRHSRQEAFPLSQAELRLLEQDTCYSQIIMREKEGFQLDQSIQKFGYLGRYEWPSLSIKVLNDNVFIARYKYASVIEGVPSRTAGSAVSYELETDNLLQVKFNSRDSQPTGEWHYTLRIFNILLTATPNSSMFMAEPTKRIHDLADLW